MAEDVRLYLFRYDRGVRAHNKLIRQLKVLSVRISEGIPRWQASTKKPPGGTHDWIAETATLRLDFECYIEVLSRFFRLCQDVTGIEDIANEPIVQQIRRVRNRIIEHGYEYNREGDRTFYCDDHGPRLLGEGMATDCPSFSEIEAQVGPLIARYGLGEADFIGRFSVLRGTQIWTDSDSRTPGEWPGWQKRAAAE